MSLFFRKKKVFMSEDKKALLFNVGSFLDYIALGFLITIAVDKFINRSLPTVYEYCFITVTMFSWLFGLPYEWKLKWARLEGIVYVLAAALILCIYVLISITR